MKKKTKKGNETAKEKKKIDREKMIYRKQKLDKNAHTTGKKTETPRRKPKNQRKR